MPTDDDDLRFGDVVADQTAANPGGLIGWVIELFTAGLIVLVLGYVLWSFFETLYLSTGLI